jgi:hypothetical protein
MNMNREDSAREPESPEVRGRDGIANQSGPIGFFPGVHDTWQLLLFITVEYFSSPILFATRLHFPSVLFHNPRFAPTYCIFLMPVIPLPGYRR